jgi:hypothetical protein
VSEIGKKGASLENEEMADEVLLAVQQLLGNPCIKASDIAIGVYFYSQIRVYHDRVSEIVRSNPDDPCREIKILPVAQFSTTTRRIVFIDTVMGISFIKARTLGWAVPSSRLRNKHRLATAISGAIDGLILFGNIQVLTSRSGKPTPADVSKIRGTSTHDPFLALLRMQWLEI